MLKPVNHDHDILSVSCSRNSFKHYLGIWHAIKFPRNKSLWISYSSEIYGDSKLGLEKKLLPNISDHRGKFVSKQVSKQNLVIQSINQKDFSVPHFEEYMFHFFWDTFSSCSEYLSSIFFPAHFWDTLFTHQMVQRMFEMNNLISECRYTLTVDF